MKTIRLIKGIATYVPGLRRFSLRRTGGTDSARYCYSVWLRHLVKAAAAGLPTDPETVAELGPGDSLGTGIAALLSGATTYHALDVVSYAARDSNMRIMRELVDLFTRRESIPDEEELPRVRPLLDSYDFPGDVLTDERLGRALAARRLKAVEAAVAGKKGGDIGVGYIVPWCDPDVIRKNSVDIIFSQAVLEHSENLAEAYAAMYAWLKPGGYMSHEIDFKSHGFAEEWNGHWTYSDLTWKLIKGKRPYLLNREPCSTHLRIIEETGFRIVRVERERATGGAARRDLAERFRNLPEDDLTTCSVFVQAVKEA
jgi:SAM-dependent methyltransferase